MATALGLHQLVYVLCHPNIPFTYFAHAYAWAHLGNTTGDFAVEIGSELAFFTRRLTGRHTPPAPATGKANLGRAFGVEGYTAVDGGQREGTYAFSDPRMSYDDDIRLTPYTGSLPHHGDASIPEYDDVSKLESQPRAM
jgi:hypothetical protein